MKLAVLITKNRENTLDHRSLQIIAAVALLHILFLLISIYGFPAFNKKKLSEITIEIGASRPRGGGGDGARSRPQPVAPDTKKTLTQDELANKRSKQEKSEQAKPQPSAASSASSAPAGVESAPVVDADYKASYLNNPKPPYPPVAFQLKIEGTVMIKAHVQPDGTCKEVLLGRSSGNDMLDQSALNTVAQWKFVPAKSQGKEISQWVSIPITFALKRR